MRRVCVLLPAVSLHVQAFLIVIQDFYQKPQHNLHAIRYAATADVCHESLS